MLINGPINIVKLEGNGKTLTVFMDIHLPVSAQKQCKSFEAIDVDKFLYKLFKKSKDTIDFIFEIRQEQIKSPDSTYKEKYIEEILRLYKSKHKSNKNPNVRMHFLDIRDFFWNKYYDIANEIINNTNFSYGYYNKNTLDIFIDQFNSLKSALMLLEDMIVKNKTDVRMINKIHEKYNNTNVRNNMKYFFVEIKKLFKITYSNIDFILTKLNEHIQTITSQDLLNISKTNGITSYFYGNDISKYKELQYHANRIISEIDGVMIWLFAYVTDIYFLRRFLDKDYITNAISYTGNFHSLNYIQHLVCNYGFKITYASYSKEKDLNKLTDIIRKTDNDFNSEERVRQLIPEVLTQCSKYPSK